MSRRRRRNAGEVFDSATRAIPVRVIRFPAGLVWRDRNSIGNLARRRFDDHRRRGSFNGDFAPRRNLSELSRGVRRNTSFTAPTVRYRYNLLSLIAKSNCTDKTDRSENEGKNILVLSDGRTTKFRREEKRLIIINNFCNYLRRRANFWRVIKWYYIKYAGSYIIKRKMDRIEGSRISLAKMIP